MKERRIKDQVHCLRPRAVVRLPGMNSSKTNQKNKNPKNLLPPEKKSSMTMSIRKWKEHAMGLRKGAESSPCL